MSDSNNEKSKNELKEPAFGGYEPERGFFLTLYLVLVMVVSLYGFWTQYRQADDMVFGSDSLLPLLVVPFAIQGIIIACAVAMWNWKKWGVYGLGAAYIINIVMVLTSRDYARAATLFVGLVILVLVVGSRIEMFD